MEEQIIFGDKTIPVRLPDDVISPKQLRPPLRRLGSGRAKMHRLRSSNTRCLHVENDIQLDNIIII